MVGSIALLASACTGPARSACTPGMTTPMAVFTLYFGKAITGRADLTEPEWQSFLDDTVTANLPNGYTVLDADGAWMNPLTHRTTREATKVVVAALPDRQDNAAAIERVRQAYRTRFHQLAVGMTIEQACGAF
jgi:hypothetical protein